MCSYAAKNDNLKTNSYRVINKLKTRCNFILPRKFLYNTQVYLFITKAAINESAKY